MLESSNLVTFNGLANSSSYDAFLLDEERGRLLVGAEDHLFSFDLVNINRDLKQVKIRCTQLHFGNSLGIFYRFVWEFNAHVLLVQVAQYYLSSSLFFSSFLLFFSSLLLSLLLPLESITPALSPFPSCLPLSVLVQTGLSIILLLHLD